MVGMASKNVPRVEQQPPAMQKFICNPSIKSLSNAALLLLHSWAATQNLNKSEVPFHHP